MYKRPWKVETHGKTENSLYQVINKYSSKSVDTANMVNHKRGR